MLAETARLHAGDEANRALWREFVPACLDEIQRVARETPKMVDDPAKVWLQRMDAVVKK